MEVEDNEDELIWAFHNPEVKEFAMKSHILRPLITIFDEAFKKQWIAMAMNDGREVDIHEFLFCKRMAKAEIARLKSLGVKIKEARYAGTK